MNDHKEPLSLATYTAQTGLSHQWILAGVLLVGWLQGESALFSQAAIPTAGLVVGLVVMVQVALFEPDKTEQRQLNILEMVGIGLPLAFGLDYALRSSLAAWPPALQLAAGFLFNVAFIALGAPLSVLRRRLLGSRDREE